MRFGTVTSVNPFKVYLNPKMEIGLEFLEFISDDMYANLNTGDKLTMLRMQGATKMIVLGKDVSGKSDILPNKMFERVELREVVRTIDGKAIPHSENKGKVFADIKELLKAYGQEQDKVTLGGEIKVIMITGDPANPSKVRSATFTLRPGALEYEKFEYTSNAQNRSKAKIEAQVVATVYQVDAEPFVELLNWVFDMEKTLEVREEGLSLESNILKGKVSNFKQHVDKSLLVNLGFSKINDYYVIKGTQTKTDVIDCVNDTGAFNKFNPDPIIERHLRDISDQDVEHLNMIFSLFDISSRVRKCLFFAQIALECALGQNMNESASEAGKPLVGDVTRTNLCNWFKQHKSHYEKDSEGNYTGQNPYKFKGSGAIHLTGSYNYGKFNELVKDDNVMEYGSEYVAYNYPWLVAGWYWGWRKYKGLSLNEYADRLSGKKLPQNGGNFVTTDPEYKIFVEVTQAINGGTNGLEKRANYYNEFLDIIK